MDGRGSFAREVVDLLTRCTQQHPAKRDARSRDAMQRKYNADPVAHGDMPIKVLRALAGGCGPGIIFTLEFACLLKSKVVVKAVLQLCRRVACMHTQQEFLDTCERGKRCPSCLWVHLAVCLEQHPDLSPQVADILEQLMHDRRREIVKLIMAPMRLIRRAWSRTHDWANPELITLLAVIVWTSSQGSRLRSAVIQEVPSTSIQVQTRNSACLVLIPAKCFSGPIQSRCRPNCRRSC